MANNSYVPAQTAYSRVFLIDGRARYDHTPGYFSSLKMTGLSQNFGDVTKIEMPDPSNYGKFVEVGSIRGASERATTSLVGRYASAIKSELLRLASKGCAVDVQLHFGQCANPAAFNDFSKAVILEDAILTSYSTEDMGALGSDENAKVDETLELSARKMYEVTPMTFARKADDLLANQVLDTAIADSQNCGDCGFESDGCKIIFAITKSPGGSPSTPADILSSLDKGATWKADDIDALTTASDPSSVAGVGDYVVVISQALPGIYIALLSTFKALGDPSFTKVTTGLVAGGNPVDIWSLGRYAFIVGDHGYIYGCSDPTAGVTVLDAGAATVDGLKKVHAFSLQAAVAVGANGAIVYTTDGVNWTPTTATPVGIGVTLNAVWMRSATEWWVGSSAGNVYVTKDSGATWTAKTMPGTAPTAIKEIAFSTSSVGFIAATVSSHGKIFRTFDGGDSWVVTPGKVGSIPLSDEFTALSACAYDPDFLVAGGLHDNAADGVLIVGNGS